MHADGGGLDGRARCGGAGKQAALALRPRRPIESVGADPESASLDDGRQVEQSMYAQTEVASTAAAATRPA